MTAFLESAEKQGTCLWTNLPHFIIFLSAAAVRAQLRNDPEPKRRNEGQREPHAAVSIQLSDTTVALFHLKSPPEPQKVNGV